MCNTSIGEVSCQWHASCINNACVCDENWLRETDFYGTSAVSGCALNQQALFGTWFLCIAVQVTHVVMLLLILFR